MADNLDIWVRREKTDPAHTKKVNQRGGFTAIDAYYQFRCLTEEFGPVGKGWGYSYEFHAEGGDEGLSGRLVVCYLNFWYIIDHDTNAHCSFPSVGAKPLYMRRKDDYVLDEDAYKKALTDAITKAVSMLGFNADVFLGKYDDNKYVQEIEREFTEPAKPEKSKRSNGEWSMLTDVDSLPVPECVEGMRSMVQEMTGSAAAVSEHFRDKGYKSSSEVNPTHVRNAFRLVQKRYPLVMQIQATKGGDNANKEYIEIIDGMGGIMNVPVDKLKEWLAEAPF